MLSAVMVRIRLSESHPACRASHERGDAGHPAGRRSVGSLSVWAGAALVAGYPQRNARAKFSRPLLAQVPFSQLPDRHSEKDVQAAPFSFWAVHW